MDLKQTLELLVIGAVVVYCVMPLILFAAVFFLVRRMVRNLSTVDVDRIRKDYDALRAAHPADSTDQLVRRIIRRQAFRAGVVGAITGFGGFFTLIIGLPVDILLSTRIQATMVEFIAAAYGHARVSETEQRVRQFLILSGGRRIAGSTTEALVAFAVRFVGESLAKLIPLIGAAISFAVNYALAQAAGNVAQRWYAGQKRSG